MITSSQVWVLSRCLGLQQTEETAVLQRRIHLQACDDLILDIRDAGYGYTRCYTVHSIPHWFTILHHSLQRNWIPCSKLPSDVDSNLLLKLNWYFYCCLRFIDDNYAFQVIVWSIICHYHERVKSLGSTIEISFLVKLAHFNYFGWEGKNNLT